MSFEMTGTPTRSRSFPPLPDLPSRKGRADSNNVEGVQTLSGSVESPAMLKFTASLVPLARYLLGELGSGPR